MCAPKDGEGENAMELVSNELHIQVFQSDSAFWGLVFVYSRKKTKFLR